jgi:hypothetical protein
VATATNIPPTFTAAPSTHTPTPVILLTTVTPTNTAASPTNTPLPPTTTATRIPTVALPTNTPISVDITGSFLEIFGNTTSNENLAGGSDYDAAGIRDLVIRWTLSFPAEGLTAFHVYMRTNDSSVFQYLGQSPGSATQLVWVAGSQQIAPVFRLGPQPGNSYAFLVYALTASGSTFGALTTTVPITYSPGQPLSADLQAFNFGAVAYDSANANDLLTSATLQIRDSVFSKGAVIGTTDFDAPAYRGLTIAWNLEGINPVDLRGYHVYVRPNRQATFDFLCAIPDGQTKSIDWIPGNPSITGRFRSGPQLGSFYEFIVYALTNSGTPVAYGPITVNGPISYTAGSVLSPELAAFDFGGVQMQSTVTVTDDLTTTADLSGGTDTDTSGDEALVIRWHNDEIILNGQTLDPSAITDIHVFTSVNGDPLSYLGRTNNPNTSFFEWRANNGNILTTPFLNGPQPNTLYHFAIFLISNIKDDNNRFLPAGPFFTQTALIFNP